MDVEEEGDEEDEAPSGFDSEWLWDICAAIKMRSLRTRKAKECVFDLNGDKFDAIMGFLDKK